MFEKWVLENQGDPQLDPMLILWFWKNKDNPEIQSDLRLLQKQGLGPENSSSMIIKKVAGY